MLYWDQCTKPIKWFSSSLMVPSLPFLMLQNYPNFLALPICCSFQHVSLTFIQATVSIHKHLHIVSDVNLSCHKMKSEDVYRSFLMLSKSQLSCLNVVQLSHECCAILVRHLWDTRVTLVLVQNSHFSCENVLRMSCKYCATCLRILGEFSSQIRVEVRTIFHTQMYRNYKFSEIANKSCR